MIGLEEFKQRVAANWSVSQAREWLSVGAATLADCSADTRLLAFKPLLLDAQAEFSDQVLAAINELREREYQTACMAIGEIVKALPTRSSAIYVDFFFKLASTLKTPEFSRSLRDLLRREIVRNHIDIWTPVIRSGFIGLCDYPYSNDLDDVYADVKSTSAWWPVLARHYLISRLRTQSNDWLALLSEFESELRCVKEQERVHFSLFVFEFAKVVKPKYLERDLPQLLGGNLRWLADDLIGEGNPVTIDDEFRLRHGRDAALPQFDRPDLNEAELRDYIKYFHRKKPSSRVAVAEVNRRLLGHIEAVEAPLAVEMAG